MDHRDFDQDQQKVAVESSKAGPTYNSESKTKGTQEANQSADVIQDGDIDETAALLFAGTPHEDQQVDIGVDSEEKVAGSSPYPPMLFQRPHVHNSCYTYRTEYN